LFIVPPLGGYRSHRSGARVRSLAFITKSTLPALGSSGSRQIKNASGSFVDDNVPIDRHDFQFLWVGFWRPPPANPLDATALTPAQFTAWQVQAGYDTAEKVQNARQRRGWHWNRGVQAQHTANMTWRHAHL
jgi:hypothetical protein